MCSTGNHCHFSASAFIQLSGQKYWGQLLEAWLALTIGKVVLRPKHSNVGKHHVALLPLSVSQFWANSPNSIKDLSRSNGNERHFNENLHLTSRTFQH